MLGSMDGLTIHEAAIVTGWSPRMLRYIESSGLVQAARSAGGYRVYGPGELQRLRTLRELLMSFDVALSEVAFAARMSGDPQLRDAIETWLVAEPEQPAEVETADWLEFEKRRNERLLASA